MQVQSTMPFHLLIMMKDVPRMMKNSAAATSVNSAFTSARNWAFGGGAKSATPLTRQEPICCGHYVAEAASIVLAKLKGFRSIWDKFSSVHAKDAR
jgi:hypothetical protein